MEKEIKRAETARRLYVIMGRPSKADFQKMLQKGKIRDNPVVMEDYNIAEKIYGKDLGIIKGKTVQSKPRSVTIDVQTAEHEKHNIVLAVDVMSFTGLSFLVTVSRSIRFITASLLTDRKKKTLVQALIQVANVYKGKRHKLSEMNFMEHNQPVHIILGDNEFEAMRVDMESMGIAVNIMAKEEHVPEIERQQRVIKERASAVIQTLSYQNIPRKMRISLIHNVVYWLNNVPKMGQDYSPRDLIFGEQVLNYNTVCRIPFGAYAQVHDDQSITNTMESRTTGAVSLGSTENAQGTYRLLSLRTGQIVVRRAWTELPVPRDVVDRLNELALNESEYYDDENDIFDLEDRKEDGDMGKTPQEEAINQEEEQIQSELQGAQNIEDLKEHDQNMEWQEEEKPKLETDEISNDDNGGNEIGKEQTEQQNHGYNLRPNRMRDFSHQYAFLSIREGLRRFGQKGKKAILDKLQLFLDENVFELVRSPTREQIERALRVHCFLTEKRDGRIKARAVADGRSEKRYLEEETYSPTVRLESIMICSLIDVLEQRFVATIDIKGAFLKAKVPNDMELIVKMYGELAQAFVELNPNFQLDENGMLYLRCVKALYGHIEAARLFYDELDNSLINKMHFVKNKYDPCVYNKDTEDGKVTIRTHVDDLKVSSKKRRQIQIVVDQLTKIYKEITVHEGEVHDYLGMIMEHDRETRSVRISVTKYISDTIDGFINEESGIDLKIMTTPATNNLFKTRQEVDGLSRQQAGLFHAVVAKLLFVAKRARPDILLAISFLTMRVKNLDQDDWKKLLRVLGYLKGTLDLSFSVSCEKMDKLTWYVDGSYASHMDMRGQSGAVLMTGDCAVLFKSCKQKVNTRSSTEAELIAVDDILPTIQWTKMFLMEQGYDLKTELKEDNKSTMLLMKNGRLPSGKRTKHLDVRYFYAKDLIDRGILQVTHCVSEQMIADFFTKPLQGR
jgi:hypothetical protein